MLASFINGQQEDYLITTGKTGTNRKLQTGKRQLAPLATLLGLMQTASKLSAELDALASEVGGSLEKIAETAGVPFFDVHSAYVRQISRGPAKAKSLVQLWPIGAPATLNLSEVRHDLPVTAIEICGDGAPLSFDSQT